MPLSGAHHKLECTLHLEGEHQIICCHCSTYHALSPGLPPIPLIYTSSRRDHSQKSLSARIPRAHATPPPAPTLMHVFTSPVDRNKRSSSFDVAAGGLHKRHAGWWKWLVCVNYSGACRRARGRDGTHNATRVRVNIHVIAARQLLGRIRSVITGLKIKWEFFISEAACYWADGRGWEEHEWRWTVYRWKTAEKLWHETVATSKQRAFIVNMSQGNIWSFLGCVKLGNFNKTVLIVFRTVLFLSFYAITPHPASGSSQFIGIFFIFYYFLNWSENICLNQT